MFRVQLRNFLLEPGNFFLEAGSCLGGCLQLSFFALEKVGARMRVCVYVFVYVYVCICVCMYMCAYVWMYVWMYVCV